MNWKSCEASTLAWEIEKMVFLIFSGDVEVSFKN